MGSTGNPLHHTHRYVARFDANPNTHAQCSQWLGGSYTFVADQEGLTSGPLALHPDDAPLGRSGELCVAWRSVSFSGGWENEGVVVSTAGGDTLFTLDGAGADSTFNWIFDESLCVTYTTPDLAPTGE